MASNEIMDLSNYETKMEDGVLYYKSATYETVSANGTIGRGNAWHPVLTPEERARREEIANRNAAKWMRKLYADKIRRENADNKRERVEQELSE